MANADNAVNDSAINNDEIGNAAENKWPSLPVLLVDDGQSVNANTISESLYSAPVIEYITTLREKRRMRSEELHYIDHPILGLLIFITPIE